MGKRTDGSRQVKGGCLLKVAGAFLVSHLLLGFGMNLAHAMEPGITKLESDGGIVSVFLWFFLPATAGGGFVITQRKWYLALIGSVCAVIFWFFWVWAWPILAPVVIAMGVLAVMSVAVLAVSKKHFAS